jgi:histidinol-phosphate/aromatic aminotransferase/cobyric acid decarboxylase-like protein
VKRRESRTIEAQPRFPLADWIDGHHAVRHQLSQSGMLDVLRSVPPLIRSPPPATEAEVRELLGGLHGVDPARVFLTHGASEGNSVSLTTLARRIPRPSSRAPRVRVALPEYPPLSEAAELAGFHVVPPGSRVDLALFSNPHNPTGMRFDAAEVERRRRGATRVLVDETFRWFTPAPSLARENGPGVWVTGTLTKAFGADSVRLGWVIPAPEDRDRFASVDGVLTDKLGDASLAQAAALLRAAPRVLQEARGVFRTNLRYLRRRVREAPSLSAPVWFDRGRNGLRGDHLAIQALTHGVLVAPGSMFGDPSGVRVCLTRPSFPEDLDAYLAVRDLFVPGEPHRRRRSMRGLTGPVHRSR